MSADLRRFARQVFVTVAIIGLFLAFVYAIHLVLLVFAGILLAILLRTCGTWLCERTRISMNWCMAIVLIVFGGFLFGTIWMFGSEIARQADDLYWAVSQAASDFQSKVHQYRLANQMIQHLSGFDLEAVAKTTASSLLWVAAAFVLIIFLGLYLSTRPNLYTEAFLSFFNGTYRGRVKRLLEATGLALRWWLLGQLIAMAVVGVITTVGLLLIKAPMAVPLGVVAMLLTFVPYVGAIVSAIPAILLALTQDTHMVMWVILIYFIAHIVEGYIVVPLIQHKLVYLPPALILSTQFLMEIFAGTTGITFATPLMVVTMVLIKRLYFKQDWTD